MKVRWWASVVTACVVAGCSTGRSGADAPEQLGAVPLLGPGTELGDGFVVPEGAQLATWPTGEGFASDVEPVWKASMVVTGDPVELFNDLAAQATALGFEVVQQDLGNCRILDRAPPNPWASCHTDGYRLGSGSRSERVTMSVAVGDDVLPVAMVGVGLIASDRVVEFGDGPWQLRRFEPETGEAEAPEVELVPPAVRVGDRLVDADWHRTTLVEGSRLVAAESSTSCAGGMTAIVHVDGDPDVVFDAYVDQLTSRVGPHGEPTDEVPHPPVLGRRIRMMGGAGETSGAGATMVVGRDGEPTRILIQDVCAD